MPCSAAALDGVPCCFAKNSILSFSAYGTVLLRFIIRADEVADDQPGRDDQG